MRWWGVASDHFSLSPTVSDGIDAAADCGGVIAATSPATAADCLCCCKRGLRPSMLAMIISDSAAVAMMEYRFFPCV